MDRGVGDWATGSKAWPARAAVSLVLLPLLALLAVAAAGCSDGDDAKATATADATADASAADALADVDDGAGDDATDDDATETTGDGAAIPHVLELQPTIAVLPADPLAKAGPASCATFRDSRCEGGKQQTCAIYDTGAGAFATKVPALVERAYDYDRWFDRYSSPDGTAAERVFLAPMAAEVTEGVWGDPLQFDRYDGTGDGAIWTGAALTSAAMRYATTGTSADRARMVAITEHLLRHFDVTGAPGYLARHTFLLAPEKAPRFADHIVQYGEASLAPRDVEVRPSELGVLPEVYAKGLPDGNGGLIAAKPMWNGNPSIDQYTGPMMAFPIVYDLIDDPTLRKRMADHIVCYLNRLKRVEIVNLQKNPQLLESVTAYFGGGAMQLDPGDLDPAKLDHVVGYYLDDLNSATAASYDRSCGKAPATKATLVLDAASPGFLGEMLIFANRVAAGSQKTPNPEGIAHMYVPNVRGGDAVHMLHLAAMAYRFTGDEVYRTFFFETLIEDLQAIGVALTTQAFQTPDWCKAFYGDHITYTTMWQFATMLKPGPLRDAMNEVMHTEEWSKTLERAHNAQFDVMYASLMPDDAPRDRDLAIADAKAVLEAFGGNGGVLGGPRRTYGIKAKTVLDNLPPGITLACPSEAERTTCEAGIKVFGIQLAGESISKPCSGGAGECKMADGACTKGMASEGLPPGLRAYADFAWQRNPYQLGDGGDGGRKQSPGMDLSQAFWLAAHYGYLPQAKGLVLAWQDGGSCSP